MVESVEGARGALPLLAFAVSRLWEKRDRERKLLTRAAYEEIGGVAGALAQHAEATMDRIGAERQPVVREIFRNLATAQGTRAVVEREELLSAFPQRKAAEAVLRGLIDARLVTSYEVEGREGEPSHHRVEIVHESLLKAWPRLVHWQTQDEEGAQLRDQLKQAAHLWEEKGRPAGSPVDGDVVPRVRAVARPLPRCPDGARGGLRQGDGAAGRASEEAPASGRGRHRRHVTRRGRRDGRPLDTSAGRGPSRGGGKLLALGRAEIDRYPTAALAYVRGSLELADTPEARRFAVEVLWRGPVARFLSVDRIATQMGIPSDFETITFSPDGRWLAARSPDGASCSCRATAGRLATGHTRKGRGGPWPSGRRATGLSPPAGPRACPSWSRARPAGGPPPVELGGISLRSCVRGGRDLDA